MNGISIVVCYRDREEHLKQFVPHIRDVFKYIPHEIIIVEQNDNDKFRRGQLLNDGVRYAIYNRIALHDVDYLPESSEPYFGDTDVVLPVRRVIFTENDGKTPLPLEQVPSGYRHFKDGVDDNFFGGVIVFNKDSFIEINGFNTLYQGWGKEDEDLRERIKEYELTVERMDGTFYALQHDDSFPGINDPHFRFNQQVFFNHRDYFEIGYNTTESDLISNDELADKYKVDEWILSTNWTNNLLENSGKV